jgi:hypothetical protein
MESEVSYISRKLYIFIGIVGVLAASTHIYFIALCGLIVCGGVLSNILKQKSLKMGLSMMVVYIVSAGFTVFMLGGFSTKTSAGPTNELGLYSFNLNGLFNPLGWSCLLKDFKLYNPEQYEGFSYLGVGLIIILIVVMITWISDERITEKLNICRIDMLSVGIVVLVSLFISLGPIATFFERELYTLLLPDFIWKSWSVFRSTGRFVWVIIYAIDLLTIIFIYKLMNHKIAIRWLIFALCIQILDIHLVIQNKNEYFSQWSRWALIKYAISNITSFTTLPMQIVTFLGGIMLIIAITLSGIAFYQKLVGIALGGFTTVIILICFIGSIMMVSMGIMGYYVAKIFDEVKNRPKYIIGAKTNDE